MSWKLIEFVNDDVEANDSMDARHGEFQDGRYLVEKNIRDIADKFGKRTVANRLQTGMHQEAD